LSVTGHCLDKLQPSLGYIESNVVPCCSLCNSTRRTFYTPDEFKVMINALLEYRNARKSI
jgi:hypothetical protein